MGNETTSVFLESQMSTCFREKMQEVACWVGRPFVLAHIDDVTQVTGDFVGINTRPARTCDGNPVLKAPPLAVRRNEIETHPHTYLHIYQLLLFFCIYLILYSFSYCLSKRGKKQCFPFLSTACQTAVLQKRASVLLHQH